MLLYKLTDENNRTYGGLLWGKNITHEALPGDGPLCTKYWIHAYEDPLLAVLHNPIHADYQSPIMWESVWESIEEGGILRDGQLKLGVKKLTTLQRLPLPQVSTAQRVAYAILCALEVHKEAGFAAWAGAWLAG